MKPHKLPGRLKNLKTNIAISTPPLCRYPRPSMVRDSFICLNGTWFDGVVVPFPLESKLSGFKGEFDGTYIYHRSFNIPAEFIKDKVFLHFGAVDQIAEVSIDGKFVGKHVGGYLPFYFDITEFIAANTEHLLSVKITDTLDKSLPYGKQSHKSKGMWYTEVSGIWQTVWLESVPQKHIEGFTIDTTLSSIMVNVNSKANRFSVEIFDEDKCISKTLQSSSSFSISIDNPQLWSPENPHLYKLVISTENDTVSTFFGLRTIRISEINGIPRLLLNNKPYFFNGVLDQGYFPEGIFTPNDETMYDNDILHLKELGFNTIRKHIKVEPEYFYAACDRLGMIVFQDMVNNGSYNFLMDTALPTLGFRKRNDWQIKRNKKTRQNFISSMKETANHLHNFPSVVYYTVFNEGWGQFKSDMLYKQLKDLDSSRIIDSTSGWFKQNKSDVNSLHVYFKDFIMPEKESDKPIVLSEFGGYTYKVPGHIWNYHKSYGYGKTNSIEELTAKIENVYSNSVLPAIPKGLCGAIYTQSNDIENEINGFYTYDRQICKVDKIRIANLMKQISGEIKF